MIARKSKPLTVSCPIQLRKLSRDVATRRLEIAKSSILGSAADVLEESWLLAALGIGKGGLGSITSILLSRRDCIHVCASCCGLNSSNQHGCASLFLTVELSLLFLHASINHAAMCESYVAIRRCEPQLFLRLLLFSLHSVYLATILELTMPHLQKYYWTSKIRWNRKHRANKQPHGLGSLLNRG